MKLPLLLLGTGLIVVWIYARKCCPYVLGPTGGGAGPSPFEEDTVTGPRPNRITSPRTTQRPEQDLRSVDKTTGTRPTNDARIKNTSPDTSTKVPRAPTQDLRTVGGKPGSILDPITNAIKGFRDLFKGLPGVQEGPGGNVKPFNPADPLDSFEPKGGFIL